VITIQHVQELIDEQIEGSDTFVVDVQVKPGNKIQVLVDADQGLSIDRCVAISRHIEGTFDREEEDFELNVSSPGLDLPFKVWRQYKKNVGRQVTVLTHEGETLEGVLKDVSTDDIKLLMRIKKREEGSKKKKTVEQLVKLTFSAIKETRVVILFK